MGCVDVWGKAVWTEGAASCKDPEVRANLVSLWNSKEASVAGGEGLRGRVVDDEGRVVLGSLGRWWR